MIGQALFLASLQASIGSVEMSSKFSVKNFSKDQETLTNAIYALRGYLIVAAVWCIATMLVLYSSHGLTGALWALGANAIFVGWIYLSYMYAFKDAANKHGLNNHGVFE
jgi:uncharacterized membrane protein (GlpM family)